MPPHDPRVRRRRRVRGRSLVFAPARVATGTGALLGGFALGLFLLSYAPETYSRWHEGRLLKRATAMLAADDFDGAMQSAREVVQSHPNSLPAFQILAEASEKQNRQETITSDA